MRPLAALPRGMYRTTNGLVGLGFLAQPVYGWVTSDCLVVWVDHDDFEILVGRILSNPVAVQNTECRASASSTLFSNVAKSTLEVQSVDSLVGGLTHGLALGHWTFASSTSDADAVDAVALFGLVPQLAGLV